MQHGSIASMGKKFYSWKFAPSHGLWVEQAVPFTGWQARDGVGKAECWRTGPLLGQGVPPVPPPWPGRGQLSGLSFILLLMAEAALLPIRQGRQAVNRRHYTPFSCSPPEATCRQGGCPTLASQWAGQAPTIYLTGESMGGCAQTLPPPKSGCLLQ